MKDYEFDYKHFFDMTPDLLCIAGYDGYFKKINPAVSNVLGYSEEELYSRPINDFVYKEDKEITNKVRNDLTRSIPLHNFENRYQTKNGEVVWLSWTSLPVDSKELVYAIAKDVTHRKKLEEDRMAMLENLAKTNKELKTFNLTASHDLRSPLNGLISVFELLDTSRINDQESRELMEVLKLTGENLKETLNNYVDILSQKLGEKTKLEEVNLEESLNQVLDSIRSLVQTSGATIKTDFSETKTVRFNRRYMESIYLNLVTNAIKYAKEDTPPVISIYSEIRDSETYLNIADNGVGFDMDKVNDKIFGLHETFHNHHDSKGVGLYLVKNHITSLGGSIDVESKVDMGSRFIIRFPS